MGDERVERTIKPYVQVAVHFDDHVVFVSLFIQGLVQRSASKKKNDHYFLKTLYLFFSVISTISSLCSV